MFHLGSPGNPKNIRNHAPAGTCLVFLFAAVSVSVALAWPTGDDTVDNDAAAIDTAPDRCRSTRVTVALQAGSSRRSCGPYLALEKPVRAGDVEVGRSPDLPAKWGYLLQQSCARNEHHLCAHKSTAVAIHLGLLIVRTQK